VLLGDPFHPGDEHAEIVDVAGVGDHRGGERLRLRARFAVMRLVEEVADLRVAEQGLVHAVRDRRAMCLQSRHRGFHEINRPVAESRRHFTSPELGESPD
jgi:hypothetical protein